MGDIEPAKGTAVGLVLIDNERVRVIEWRFPKKGDNTGWHRQGYDYVVIPLFDGILEIDLENGERVIVNLPQGVPYYREAGVKHDMVNGNDFECAFIETELLEPSKLLLSFELSVRRTVEISVDSIGSINHAANEVS